MSEHSRRLSRKRKVVIREKRSVLWLVAGIFTIIFGLVRLAWALRVGVEWVKLKSVADFLSSGGAAVCLLAAGGITVAIYLFRTIWRPRLVLGKRYVQLRRGQKIIVGQIPYRNIVSVEQKDYREWCESNLDYREIRHFFLEVILLEWHDPDTWWPAFADDPEIVLRSLRGGGIEDGSCPEAHTIVIRDVYEMDLPKIRRFIIDQVQPFWEDRRSKQNR